MKNTTITLLGLSLCALAPLTLAQEPATPAPAPEATAPAAEQEKAPANPSDEKAKEIISHFLGYETGIILAADDTGPIQIDDLDKDVFFNAIEDGLNNRVDSEIEKKDLRANIQAFTAKLEARSKAASEKNLDAAPAAEQEKSPATPSDEEVKEVISYYLGYQTGQRFAATSHTGPLQIDDIDKDVFFNSVEEGLSHFRLLTAYASKKNLAASKENLAASKAFFEENGKKEGVTTTESGLQYKVLTPSDGRKYDEKKDGEVVITFEGRLLDGTVFDKGEKYSSSVEGVIPGFAEALKLMPVGSEWEIYIPSELGYREYAPSFIGSNAALIFKVKLHDIAPKKGSENNPIQLTPELLQQLQEAGMQPVPQEQL